jgi:hypothetical protein
MIFLCRAEVDTIQIWAKQGSQKSVTRKDSQELKQSRIFHFSGHSIVQRDTPTGITDEPGMAHQLTDRKLGCCRFLRNGGIKRLWTGLEMGMEGIVAGRALWKQAQELLCIPLWSVNDRSTAGIMSSFILSCAGDIQ